MESRQQARVLIPMYDLSLCFLTHEMRMDCAGTIISPGLNLLVLDLVYMNSNFGNICPVHSVMRMVNSA